MGRYFDRIFCSEGVAMLKIGGWAKGRIAATPRFGQQRMGRSSKGEVREGYSEYATA
jgi:hypothetical protein